MTAQVDAALSLGMEAPHPWISASTGMKVRGLAARGNWGN